MKYENAIKLSLSIITCELAGIVGSFFTISSVKTWYVGIIKPVFNPPNWIFGPVWTILFVLMGISLWIIWTSKESKEKRRGLILFFIQLGLNVLWSVLFFGLHLLLLSFVEIILLWIFILLTILEFKKISKNASYLLWPYIIWVSFAAILNLSIWILN